ncbi:hypothetical protein MUN84_04665 [Hymenobacter sp. 5516J-16]|uniref:Histidine kinase n=1 Tax=Hymenobacter sublimis TaxID=2933777 RepID=A0ABY4J7V3_9BACT|nr:MULTISPECIES: hypothetical protein [Hymenobacter]UOQ77937.1 hypothetical protein MUN84_04665 [Hymenobacter sp. 5516J-16]UPL47921.1 hypothetical protein MWH26_12020 [Hymenobacter sublimis]
MDLTHLDFQQARIKQVLFKSRLRSILYGVREPDATLFSMRQNPLGEWLYSVVKPRYGAALPVQRLEQELQRMIDTGRGLVQQYQGGQLEESRSGLERLDAHAARIEAYLKELEQLA